MARLSTLFGDPNKRILKRLHERVLTVRAFDDEVKAMDDGAIRERIHALREEVVKGTKLDDVLPEVFALTREAAARTVSMRHFDVQLIGGVVMHERSIAEMKTGEGKTLVATLTLALNALTGKGAHLVTVNDYLARRDAVWMGPVYHFLGLSVGCIQHDQAFLFDPEYQSEDESFAMLRPVARGEAYAADITYGTNNEFGFDYLRDNMATELSGRVQRGHAFAIIDEVDSILIDEARTPLIISAPAEEATDLYAKIAGLVPRLEENDDYNTDEKMHAVTLTEGGIGKMEKWLNIGNLYEEGGVKLVHHIDQALKAHALYHKDKQYVVKEGQIVIVDEFTGRLMEGRRYSEGLHQAIEAKEGVEIMQENRTFATISLQNYFRLYDKLAGMTGTAATEAEEFHKIYNLDVVQIPPNKEIIRDDKPDAIYKSEEAKFAAVIRDTKERSEKGQPVLIGTVSIEKNEVLHDLLSREGIPHEVLNAKNHEREAKIIENAGAPGAVTIATNMAGRGVDIVLGGKNGDKDDRKHVIDLGGLHVVGTERHESRRIDNQLRGRSGRQGDPGSSRFFVSMDDDLMRIFGGERMKSIMERLRLPDDMPVENRMISRSIEAAQKKVEGRNFDVRKHLVEYDDVMNRQREIIYKRRRAILETAEENPDELRVMTLDSLHDEVRAVVSMHTAAEHPYDWNTNEIITVLSAMFPLSEEAKKTILAAGKGEGGIDRRRDELGASLEKEVDAAYDTLEKRMGDPMALRRVEKLLTLRSIDTLWIEHLDNIEYLRTGIGLHGYAQRDPLVEYKREAFAMFDQLLSAIRGNVVNAIFKIGDANAMMAASQRATNLIERAPDKTMEKGSGQFASFSRPAAGGASSSTMAARDSSVHEKASVPNTVVKDGALRTKEGGKIGRNDPCPCGSGKKYKKCHGA